MLDASTLAIMRDTIEDLLPDTAQIITITRAADGQGGWTDTRGTASAVSFRLDVISGREQVTGGAVQPYTSLKCSFPYDTAITTENEVLHEGITYAVKSVNIEQSWIAVRRVELERI